MKRTELVNCEQVGETAHMKYRVVLWKSYLFLLDTEYAHSYNHK